MNTAELDILTWLAAEHRPLSSLLAMTDRDANAWVRAHGGKARHVDMYCRLQNSLRYRLLADLPGTVARLDVSRLQRRQRPAASPGGRRGDDTPPEAA